MVTVDSRIQATLESTFGFPSFRPLQEDIVRTILEGRDVFALMPTGGGKSLCYQLPALLLDGFTVVVSPLISLMKDQVDALRTLGVPATFINSSLEQAEINRRQAALSRGSVKLAYVAPERLMTSGFLHLLHDSHPALFAVDEAHCISEWGHDFRPEYRELSRLRELLPAVPLAAFTATATHRVQADILSQLNLKGAATFRGRFNRSNLFYEVRPKRDAYPQLLTYLRQRSDASGIIYCASRAGTEDLARRLRLDGLSAVAYHAGLESDERRKRQEAFIDDDVRVIVATVAFGMGIDKPDVRFVIHYDLPKTLENYYQESGRAGRDGEPSDCILFYTPGDVWKVRHFADDKGTEAERRIAAWQVQQVADWAESDTCRRRALLAYFEEQFDGQDAPCCDVCRDPSTVEDVTVAAQMFLSCVKRTGERFGATHVINVLRGSQEERVLRLGHHTLSTYGIGRDRSEEDWRRIGRELIRGGYLSQDLDRYNALQVTERGRAVLFQGEKVTLTVRQRARAEEASSAPSQPHADLFEELRRLRKRLADERQIPPYVIFHDRTLREMAARLPRRRNELLTVPGVGQRKALDFGEDFLAVIATYVEETRAESEPLASLPRRPRRTRGELGGTVFDTLELFRQGMNLEEIASARGLVRSTIEGHLVEAMEAGERVEIERLVSPEKLAEIRRAMELLGSELLGPVMEYLGEGYTYGELRLVRAAATSVR